MTGSVDAPGPVRRHRAGARTASRARLRRTALPGPLHLGRALAGYRLLSLRRAAAAWPGPPLPCGASTRPTRRWTGSGSATGWPPTARTSAPAGAVGPVHRRRAQRRRRRRHPGAGRDRVQDRPARRPGRRGHRRAAPSRSATCTARRRRGLLHAARRARSGWAPRSPASRPPGPAGRHRRRAFTVRRTARRRGGARCPAGERTADGVVLAVPPRRRRPRLLPAAPPAVPAADLARLGALADRQRARASTTGR